MTPSRLLLLAAAAAQVGLVSSAVCSLRSVSRRVRRAALPFLASPITPFTEDNLWPNARVPYRFSGEYERGSLRKEKADIEKAMRLIQRYTCIRFIPIRRTPRNGEVYLNITNGEECASYVGRRTEVVKGTRFGHEQARPDRFKHVHVNWDNIPRDAWFTFQEDIDAHYHLNYTVPYDFASILHYGPFDFAINDTQQSLFSIQPFFTVRENSVLSFLDVWKVNQAYSCSVQLDRLSAACVDLDPACNHIPPHACAYSPFARLTCQRLCRTCRPPTTSRSPSPSSSLPSSFNGLLASLTPRRGRPRPSH